MLESKSAPEGAPVGEAAPAANESVTDPGSDRIAALKAARRAAAGAPAAKPPELKPAAGASPAAPAPAAPPKTEAEVDISDGELKQFTATQKEIRRLQAQNKQLAADAAEAATLKKYRELKAAGKHAEAADLIELDVDAVVAARLKSSIPLTPEQQEIADLKKKVDDVTATTEGQKKRDTELAAANAAAAKEKNSQTVIAFVAEKKAEFPFLSRNAAWVATAYDEALTAYGTLAKEGNAPKTNAERDVFVRAFLDEAEAEHAVTAKLYGAAADSNGSTNRITDRSQARNPPAANGNRRAETPNQNKKLTFEEVRYRRRK